MKTAIYVLIFAFLLHFTASAQHRIEVKDKAPLTVKVVSYNEQLVHFQTLTGTLDSIPTEQVSRIAYGDSLQVLVFPELMKGKRQLLTQAQFLEAMQASDYATLFHAYTHLYDVQFAATKSGLLLTPESRQKLAPLIRMLKIKQALHLTIAVHADSVGKAPANQLLTERRAKALSAELLRNGIANNRFAMLAKGESEPFLIRPSLSRRIEIIVDKVAQTKVLYAEKYIPPPPPPKPVVVAAPPKAQESNPKPTKTTKLKEEEEESNYRYWTLTVGGEAAQLLASQSPQWTDEKVGMGLKMGVGGSVRYTYRFNKTVGLVGEAGYTQWSSSFYFKQNLDTLYNYSINLYRVALSAGFKIFVGRHLYILPKAHIEGLQLHEKGLIREANLNQDRIQRTVYWGSSGTLGYEFQLGRRIITDLSLSYIYLPKKVQLFDFTSHPNDPIHAISFRLGFGLSSSHK